MHESDMESLFKRRSIRKYTGELVTPAQVELILRAGFAAPSAHNRQPWHFLCISDKMQLDRLAEVHPYAKMLPSAGFGIVVCGDKQIQESFGFLIEDCSAAIQNMLIAATGLELGSVWCGLYPVDELMVAYASILELPENVVPIGLVVIGKADEVKNETTRYLKERVHDNKW